MTKGKGILPSCALRAPERTQRQLLSDLISRVFGGSTNNLVMQALHARKISPDEIQQIRSLLDDLEENKK